MRRVYSALHVYSPFLTFSGNMIEWCLPEDIDLEGVEFKAMSSGSHTQLNDFVWVFYVFIFAGIILCKRPANKRRHYNATSSLIGWSHSQNDPWFLFGLIHQGTFSQKVYEPIIQLLVIVKIQFAELFCEKWLFNSLAPGRSECDFKNVIFNLVLLIGLFRFSWGNALRWMPEKRTVDKSALVQVMAWCRQTTSHYLNHGGWLSSLSPCGFTRPQWV